MEAAMQAYIPFDDIDDASAELILQLQLLEIEELKAARPGKQKEGSNDDNGVAALLFEENLQSLQTLLADRRMTKSIADAVQADGPILTRSTAEEQTASEDHAFAHRLNGSQVISETHLQPESINDSLLSKLAGRFVSETVGRLFGAGQTADLDEDHEEPEPESSAWAGLRERREQSGALNNQCVACGESKKYFDLIAAPCQHNYCRACLRSLFDTSLTDESLFPPRCCRQPIPPNSVE